MKGHYTMMAAYNRWANGRIYEAAEALSDDELGRDVGAFFGSMLGTLNHILVADRIWMKRFTGEGDAPTRLDAILHDRLADLKAAREVEDARIEHYVGGLADAAFERTFSYRTIVQPATVTQRLSPALAHFFNHQTHHRGQAHTILSQLNQNPPSLDLIYFQRTEAGARFM
ncbi:DinB family protein [Nitratireductor luteus]|uniref:DinB family protein n=1 Tax=Nitratireductor luteus TaxID=2976980 RepID=UPI00223FC657|nr:DinB family protein [Nitratireductor luteus]